MPDHKNSSTSFSALDRQKEIFVNGLSHQRPLVPLSFSELEAKAKSVMSKKAFAYVAGGAGNGSTMERNRSAFHEWQILPRMLKDVSVRDTSIELFGRKLPSPFLLTPIGVSELAHPQADIAVAKAASKLKVPMIFSNQASFPMEKVAQEMGDSPRWFQLYWSKSDELVASLARRAEACGCEAIVVTLDTTMLGWRVEDLELGYLPFLQGLGIAQYTSDPVFNKIMDEINEADSVALKPPITINTIRNIIGLMRRYPGGFFQNIKTKRPLTAVRTFINIYSRPSLTWDKIPFLRKQTKLPILLKGIIHPDDARRAIDIGVDGIIVSNHGGRQVEGSVSSIEMLPEIIKTVDDKIPTLIDSGIRTGSDMFKAIALGAKAVCLGRPWVYGLALEGEAGVDAVLKNLMADFELTMGLAGCKSVSEIDKKMLRKK